MAEIHSLIFGSNDNSMHASDISMMEDTTRYLLQQQQQRVPDWTVNEPGHCQSPHLSDRDSGTSSPTADLADLSYCSLSSSTHLHSPDSAYGTHSQRLSETDYDLNSHFNSYPALCDAVTLSPESINSEGCDQDWSRSSGLYCASESEYNPVQNSGSYQNLLLGGSASSEKQQQRPTSGKARKTSSSSSKPKRKRVLNTVQRSEASVRERRRMVTFNSAFEDLKRRIPGFVLGKKKKRMSRIDTLNCAINYIAFLSASLEMGN